MKKQQQILKAGVILFTVFIFLGCSKEDVIQEYEPGSVTDFQQEKSVNLRADFLTFAKYPPVDPEPGTYHNLATVVFNGYVWRAISFLDYSGIQISKSEDGIHWSPVSIISSTKFLRAEMQVLNGELWLIGRFTILDYDLYGRTPHGFKSPNGVDWEPFSFPTEIRGYPLHTFVYHNRIYILEHNDHGINPNILLSTDDGEKWIVATYFFPVFTPRVENFLVLKNSVYAFVQGNLPGVVGRPDYFEVWRSDDAVNWRRLSTPAYSPTPRSSFTVGHFNDKIWIIGGSRSPDAVDLSIGTIEPSNEIWFTKNFTSWFRYEGRNRMPPAVDRKAVTFRDKLWLHGGRMDAHYIEISPTYSITE